MTSTRARSLATVVPVLAVALLAAGCSDSPSENFDDTPAVLIGTWDGTHVNGQAVPVSFDYACESDLATDMYVVQGGALVFSTSSSGTMYFNATQHWCDGDVMDDSDVLPFTFSRTGNQLSIAFDEDNVVLSGAINGSVIELTLPSATEVTSMTFRR